MYVLCLTFKPWLYAEQGLYSASQGSVFDVVGAVFCHREYSAAQRQHSEAQGMYSGARAFCRTGPYSVAWRGLHSAVQGLYSATQMLV